MIIPKLKSKVRIENFIMVKEIELYTKKFLPAFFLRLKCQQQLERKH
jgi:hypothetical protein